MEKQFTSEIVMKLDTLTDPHHQTQMRKSF